MENTTFYTRRPRHAVSYDSKTAMFTFEDDAEVLASGTCGSVKPPIPLWLETLQNGSLSYLVLGRHLKSITIQQWITQEGVMFRLVPRCDDSIKEKIPQGGYTTIEDVSRASGCPEDVIKVCLLQIMVLTPPVGDVYMVEFDL